MIKNKLVFGFIIALVTVGGWLTYRDLPSFEKAGLISFSFRPGQLSKSHAFLERQCAACHIPNQGVSAVGCISCHADNLNLLQRQPTAFHANVTSCKECHQEHRGGAKPPLVMDHLALAKLGARANEKQWNEQSGETTFINSKEQSIISALSCVSCHATRDKHQGLFGTSCLSCHSVQNWKISDYRHPSPNSRTCVQCHQSPPSHSMMHFEMVSKPIAGQGHAKVNQCFLCHQTTSWNDIKGKGWYKHH